ncbi:MAG: hypothetical protein CMJ52_02165 [Planctomycetaceae bacterium]|nr:hypothetical protein [Planctomycetaceae bacterium]
MNICIIICIVILVACFHHFIGHLEIIFVLMIVGIMMLITWIIVFRVLLFYIQWSIVMIDIFVLFGSWSLCPISKKRMTSTVNWFLVFIADFLFI